MAERVEYLVVGLGALGSATAYHLARRGHAVVGLERFALGHDRGASHDTSRILRHSYHTPAYVDLTRQAYADWAILEADTGERLVTVVGGLDLFPPDAVIDKDAYTGSLEAAQVRFELLDRTEIRRRWPSLSPPPGTVGLYQADGAIVPAGRGTAAMQAQASRHGATLLEHSPVTGLRDRGADGIEVDAAGTTYRARRVVVCADAWTNQLLAGLGVSLPLTVTLEQVTYFAPPDPEPFAPGRMPLWIWMDDPCYYAFPCYGEATVKAAQDCGGPQVDPDDRTREPDPEMLERLAAQVTALMPGVGPPVRSLRCQYTLTPDRDFLLDTVPGSPGVVVGLGAAHGFKFAPTLGRLLADLAEHGGSEVDLAPYRWDRPGLTDPAFEPEWMV